MSTTTRRRRWTPPTADPTRTFDDSSWAIEPADHNPHSRTLNPAAWQRWENDHA